MAQFSAGLLCSGSVFSRTNGSVFTWTLHGMAPGLRGRPARVPPWTKGCGYSQPSGRLPGVPMKIGPPSPASYSLPPTNRSLPDHRSLSLPEGRTKSTTEAGMAPGLRGRPARAAPWTNGSAPSQPSGRLPGVPMKIGPPSPMAYPLPPTNRSVCDDGSLSLPGRDTSARTEAGALGAPAPGLRGRPPSSRSRSNGRRC